MAVEVLALLLALSASDGTAEVREPPGEAVLAEKPKASSDVQKPAVEPTKAPATPKKAQKRVKNTSKTPVPAKKDLGSKKDVNQPKPSPKPSKATPVSKEDAEIIEHLEFLMLLDLLQDFELFEEEPS